MAAAKKAARVDEAIVIPELKKEKMILRIIGDSPLIVHAWSEKAKKQIRDKQMKQAKAAKEAKNPEQDYQESLYHLSDGGYGFPYIGFKACAVDACSFADGITKVVARGAFHVPDGLVRINGIPEMREDMVKIAMGTTDLRYRGMFREWNCELEIIFNPNVLSKAQIANLFNLGGFSVGVGEWRPARDGECGRFHVEV